MPTTGRRYSKEEFARRGDAIYEREIRPKLQPADLGQFVAIDIETGRFAIRSQELDACDALRAEVADAQIWMVRIGSRAVHHLGNWEPRGRS